MKRIPILFFATAAIITVCTIARAQQPYQISVVVEATIQEQPPRIVLSWLKDDSAKSYTVSRMDPNGNWKSVATSGSYLTWTDSNVVVGVPYEYVVRKTLKSGTQPFTYGCGYVYTGIDVAAEEARGTAILMVDDTFATALGAELARWKSDLIADGWNVIRHDVKRSAKVEGIKALVQNDMNADPNARALFLFGHIPVAYSGFLHPDGHPNHFGAWPADVYYGDFEDFTDEMEDTNVNASILENQNRPGDGKFDQSTTMNGSVDLEIGRVDMWDLPAFSKPEKELLRDYLNKDHAFRSGALTAPKRALMSDNFGSYGEGFAADGWRSFGNLVGKDNINQLGWFTTLDTAKYLWAYGCGGGWFTSASGIGSTTDFATTDTKAIFTMLFGSYFGDWNVENSFLRAPLTSSSTLTCFWGGRPHWYVHHMAMGKSIGFSTQLSQNSAPGGVYDELNYGPEFPVTQGVHMALMGDPTLRMSYEQVPSNFTSINAQAVNNHTVRVVWATPAGAEGFNIYRSNHLAGPYARLNAVPMAAMSYTDSVALTSDSNYYVVRAIAKAGDSHGTYYSVGQASNAVVVVGLADVAEQHAGSSSLRVYSDGPFLQIALETKNASAGRLAVYDIAGREVRIIDPSVVGEGSHGYTLDSRSKELASGVYFVRYTSPKEQHTEKFIW